MNKKIDTFGQVNIRNLAIFGVEIVVLWSSKLLWSCLGGVWALFSASKAILLGVFSLRIGLENDPENQQVYIKKKNHLRDLYG